MSYKEIIDNVSNIENLDNTTILKVLVAFEKQISEYIEQQSGTDNILNVEFVPTENALTYDNGIADYFGELKITLLGGVVSTKPCNIKFNITGSETIVVDVDEFDNTLEIHLDNDIIAKIDRSLLLPLARPTETKLVAVDDNNAQEMLGLSEDFEIDNGVIKTTDNLLHSDNGATKTNVNDLSMCPSGNVVNIGTKTTAEQTIEYTALANGYVFFSGDSGATESIISLRNKSTSFQVGSTVPSYNYFSMFIPCAKGDVIEIKNTVALTNLWHCKFVYAKEIT